MTASFKVLKNCDNKTKDIVNGYIHEIQKVFPWQENSYFLIPDIINHICLSFYWIRFEFNKKYMGENVKIINDTKVQKIKNNAHSLCAIGSSISGNECDLFRIEYRLEKELKTTFCPYIGYFMLKSIDSSSKIKWDQAPGSNRNADISIGIAIYSVDKNYLYLYKKEFDGYKALPRMEGILQSGDRFKMEIDFVNKKCKLYHNDNPIDYTIKLESEYIIPCLSLHFQGEIIEITKYEFVFNK